MIALPTPDELATVFFTSFQQQMDVIEGKAKSPIENPEFEKLINKLQEQFPGLLTPFVFILSTFIMALMDAIALNNLVVVEHLSQEEH